MENLQCAFDTLCTYAIPHQRNARALNHEQGRYVTTPAIAARQSSKQPSRSPENPSTNPTNSTNHNFKPTTLLAEARSLRRVLIQISEVVALINRLIPAADEQGQSEEEDNWY